MADAAAACRRRGGVAVGLLVVAAAVVSAEGPVWLLVASFLTGFGTGWSALTLLSKGYTQVRWVQLLLLFLWSSLLSWNAPLAFLSGIVLIPLDLTIARSREQAHDYWVDGAYEEHPLDPLTWSRTGRARI